MIHQPPSSLILDYNVLNVLYQVDNEKRHLRVHRHIFLYITKEKKYIFHRTNWVRHETQYIPPICTIVSIVYNNDDWREGYNVSVAH